MKNKMFFEMVLTKMQTELSYFVVIAAVGHWTTRQNYKANFCEGKKPGTCTPPFSAGRHDCDL